MLGEQIRLIRERRGLSVRDVSEASGLSAEAVSAVERGARYPSLHTLECVAMVLKVTIIIGPDSTEIVDSETTAA